MQLTDNDQANRITVWHALSELFTGRELQDYDYRWMAGQKKMLSGLSRST